MNRTFKINCIQSDPQAGLCDESPNCVSNCSNYSQSVNIVLDPLLWNNLAGIVQHLCNLCHLSLIFQAENNITLPTTPVGTLPPGFTPLQNLVGLPFVTNGAPPVTGTLDISTAGVITITSIGFPGTINSQDVISLDIIFPC